MLDELAIETAQEKSRHKEELSDVRLQHEKEVLSIRARYEKELRGLHEEKNRTEEEIRSQLRDERVRNLCRLKVERICRLRHEHSTKQNKHQVFPGGLYKVYFGQKRSAKFLFAIVFFFSGSYQRAGGSSAIRGGVESSGSVYGGDEGLVWAQTQGSRGAVCLQSSLTAKHCQMWKRSLVVYIWLH